MTFYTRKAALKAQDALHNMKTLDGVSSVQISGAMHFDLRFSFPVLPLTKKIFYVAHRFNGISFVSHLVLP